MFAAASSFFSRTNISQNYVLGGSSSGSSGGGPALSLSSIGSRSASSTPAPSAPGTPGASNGTNGAAAITLGVTLPHAPTFRVGPWRVQSASHKSSGKRVSIWDLDKKAAWLEKLNPPARERAMEVLKAEATALMKLRHPSILEMVEPLEDTRSELTFATEPVLSALSQAIPGASRGSPVELDEIEIQRGVLQLCKGLVFLHTSAKMIHSNLDSDSIIINSAGDWKIAGLGLTIPLTGPDGSPTRWEFPTYDGRLDAYVQRSFDYMAPEYALDEVLVTSSDLYSLGCLIYAVHRKGDPPFKNHGSLSGVRDNAGKAVPHLHTLDTDLQALLRQLITRHPQARPSPATLPSQPFFNSLPISTLNFLERSTFATKSREEKLAFLSGLSSVLPRFSAGLRIRKILPSLVEEMKDAALLPAILPNVFAVARELKQAEFGAVVLPSLRPLFGVRDPPANMLVLLEHLGLLQEKTDKVTFRQAVLPLVYNALESEHAVVQEKALQVVPGLCESIDYAEVEGVLFTRVAVVFSKTRSLPVKVATLATFLEMVKTLDQTSLTQKMVPLLSRIRTKDPVVMMGTLAVQEAMGFKVDREAVATLVLPQLWALSMGPFLNLQQFDRFMDVIRKLGERVAKEHNQFLRDNQRIGDKSGLHAADGSDGLNGAGMGLGGSSNGNGGAINFESLVGQAGAGMSVKQDSSATPSWDDDPWGSILATTSETPRIQSPAPPMLPTPARSPMQPPMAMSSAAGPSTLTSPPPKPFSPSPLSSGPSGSGVGSNMAPRSFTTPAMSPPISATPAFSGWNSQPSAPAAPVAPAWNAQPAAPAPPAWGAPPASMTPSRTPSSSGPNYNISLPAMAPTPTPAFAPLTPMNPAPPAFGGGLQPAMGGLLAPSKPATPSWQPKKPSQADWGDFDPLG